MSNAKHLTPPEADSSDRRSTDHSVGLVIQPAANLMAQGIEEGILPGGVLVVAKKGRVVAQQVHGTKAPRSVPGSFSSDPMRLETVFDLGELTGSICTATILMGLVSVGRVEVTERASRYLQSFGIGNKSQVTLAHLLSQSSGLPGGGSIYSELVKANAGSRPGILSSSGAKQYGYNHFHNLALKFEPGQRQLESDANMIVLGEIIESITAVSLEKAFARFVSSPLSLHSLGFIDRVLMQRKKLSPMVELFAPTGECDQRERVIAGEVWDDNAWAMGGIAGHAGCFGTAQDVLVWAHELLKAYRGESNLIAQSAVRSFWSPEIPGLKNGWKLGFGGSSREAGFVDVKAAPAAVVSSGSTGCSVFIDPLSEVVIVLLSNAGFSGHTHRRFTTWRADLHQAVVGNV